MANKNLKLILTKDQQKQIREATGTSVTELNISVQAEGDLAEMELEKVVGGKKSPKSGPAGPL